MEVCDNNSLCGRYEFPVYKACVIHISSLVVVLFFATEIRIYKNDEKNDCMLYFKNTGNN